VLPNNRKGFFLPTREGGFSPQIETRPSHVWPQRSGSRFDHNRPAQVDPSGQEDPPVDPKRWQLVSARLGSGSVRQGVAVL